VAELFEMLVTCSTKIVAAALSLNILRHAPCLSLCHDRQKAVLRGDATYHIFLSSTHYAEKVTKQKLKALSSVAQRRTGG